MLKQAWVSLNATFSFQTYPDVGKATTTWSLAWPSWENSQQTRLTDLRYQQTSAGSFKLFNCYCCQQWYSSSASKNSPEASTDAWLKSKYPLTPQPRLSQVLNDEITTAGNWHSTSSYLSFFLVAFLFMFWGFLLFYSFWHICTVKWKQDFAQTVHALDIRVMCGDCRGRNDPVREGDMWWE